MSYRRAERCGPPCSIRAELSHAVTEALLFVVRAKRQYDRAKYVQQNLDHVEMILDMARLTERRAAQMLESHRKEHGC